ncbi:MAG: hypothetical protein HYU54_10620 [Actinobacteria bacterium]|nr:hypothetical protein [Actinomycetota bacterium]
MASIAGLLAFAGVRDREPEPLALRVRGTEVVAAGLRWAQVEVTVGAPSDVTFSVFPPEPGSEPVFQVSRRISDRYVFEWRGRRQDGRAAPDGRYVIEISSRQEHASGRVPVWVRNWPGVGRRPAPPPPTGLSVIAALRNTLTWERSSAPYAASYRIYRAHARRGTYELIGTTAVGAETWTDLPPERGIYWYRVSAVNVKGKEGPPSDPASSDNVHLVQTLGPAGGILEPTTGTVSLEIPPGAVGAPTEFTIDQVETPPPPNVNRILVSRVFDIGPAGTTFQTPATLNLRYDIPSAYPLPSNYPTDTTWAQFWDPATGAWKRLQGGSVHPAISTVRAPIAHLSLWAGASVTVPHGGYSSDTNLCGYCHQVHYAPGDHLFPRPTERETCYQCHNGTGAGTDIQADFGEGAIGSSTRVSTHPVPSARDGVQLACSGCHTPHKLMAEDTKLLRVLVGGSYLYSPPGSPIGNQLCYACHGAASAYPAPFGDHAGFEASIHNTSANVPFPPSGSQIKCLTCHQPHGSDYRRLTTADQEQLCFTCHTQADPNTSGGSNPYLDFNGAANDYITNDGTPVRVYHHPITTAEQAGGSRSVECESCHNSHIVDQNDSGTTSKIADPTSVLSMTSKWIPGWDTTSGYMNRASDVTQYCTKCHTDPSTTQPITAGTSVPYTISLVNDTTVDADGNIHDKFDASIWTNSRHGDPTKDPTKLNYMGCADRGLTGPNCVITCTACHDFHGSTNAYMLRQNIDAPDTTATYTMTGFTALNDATNRLKLQTFCLTCHPERGTGHNAGKLCTQCHYHGSARL